MPANAGSFKEKQYIICFYQDISCKLQLKVLSAYNTRIHLNLHPSEQGTIFYSTTVHILMGLKNRIPVDCKVNEASVLVKTNKHVQSLEILRIRMYEYILGDPTQCV